MTIDGIGEIGPYLADTLVIVGLIVVSLGVFGIIRMPDVYTKMHAASKAVFMGSIGFALASFVTSEREIIARVILIAGILMITTPVASQVIARAAALEHELMRSPGAIDESVYDLVLRDELAYLPIERGTSAGEAIRVRKHLNDIGWQPRHPHVHPHPSEQKNEDNAT